MMGMESGGLRCVSIDSRFVRFDFKMQVLWDTPSFIHCIICLTKGPMSLLKRILHRIGFGASSFNFHYFLFSLRSSTSCLRLSPRLPVLISFLLSFLPRSVLEVSSFAWCNPSVFLRFIVCRIFHSSLTVCNTSAILTR